MSDIKVMTDEQLKAELQQRELDRKKNNPVLLKVREILSSAVIKDDYDGVGFKFSTKDLGLLAALDENDLLNEEFLGNDAKTLIKYIRDGGLSPQIYGRVSPSGYVTITELSCDVPGDSIPKSVMRALGSIGHRYWLNHFFFAGDVVGLSAEYD